MSVTFLMHSSRPVVHFKCRAHEQVASITEACAPKLPRLFYLGEVITAHACNPRIRVNIAPPSNLEGMKGLVDSRTESDTSLQLANGSIRRLDMMV